MVAPKLLKEWFWFLQLIGFETAQWHTMNVSKRAIPLQTIKEDMPKILHELGYRERPLYAM